jgi:GAF domain-containing protein
MDDLMAPAEHPRSSHSEASGQSLNVQPPKEKKQQKVEAPRFPPLELLDLTDWAYFSLDSSGHLIEVSDRLAQLLSTTPEMLVGVPLASLCTPPYDTLLSEHFLQIATPRAGRVRADRLHLLLSLRFPFSSEAMDDATPSIPTEGPADSTHCADTTQSESASFRRHSTLPVELVMIFCSGDADPNKPAAEVAVAGLIRSVSPDLPEAGTLDDEQKTHLTQAEQRRAQQLYAIMEIGQRVATSEDLDTLLNYLVKLLHLDLHYRYVDVFLLDDDKKQAIWRASSNLAQGSDASTSPITSNLRFHVDEHGILGSVASSSETLLLNDLTGYPHDELSSHRPDVKSALAIPVIISEGVVGVLVVQSDTPDAFTLDDVALLRILADHIAIAIENASLLGERDQRLAELSALNQIGLLLASPGKLIDTLDAIIRRVGALFQVEAASLMLVEDGQLHFKVAAGTHIDQIKPYTLEIGQGIAGWAVQRNQIARVNDVDADPRHYPGIDQAISFDTRSLIAVPLRIAKHPGDTHEAEEEDQVLGVIEIINRLDGRPFTRHDEVLIEFIASSAAVIIENVRLFNELQRRLSEMSALLDASRAVTTLELQAVLDTIVERVSTTLNAEQAVVYLLDARGQRLVPHATNASLQGENLDKLIFTLGQGTVGWIAETRHPLRVDDAQNDPRFLALGPLSGQVHCTLGVPLMVQSELIGVLEVTNKQSQECFTLADEALLSAFAGQVALAIHNARLFDLEQRRRQLASTLQEVAAILSTTLDMDRVLNLILEQLHKVISCVSTSIALTNDGRHFQMVAARGFADTTQILRSTLVTDENLILRQIAETLEPVIIPDVSLDPRWQWIKGAHHVRAWIGAPLVAGDRLVGALMIDSLEAGAYSDEDAKVLQSFAHQAALAVENARLYREAQQRVDALAALGRASEAINRALKLDEVLKAAIEAAAAVMPSNRGVTLMLKGAQTRHLYVATYQGFDRATLDTFDALKLKGSDSQGIRLISDSLAPDFQMPDIQETVPLIGVPLRGREEVIGLIVIGAALPSYETRRLLQTLGDMVAIAIEKARLHEETSRRLAEVSTLYTLANQITTVLDLDRILETTVTIINHALDCQGCCLYLHDSQTGELALKASSGWRRREQEAVDLELIGQVSRQVLRERRPVNLRDINPPKSTGKMSASDSQPSRPISSKGEGVDKEWDTSIRSLLVVPLIAKNAPIGTLSIDDRAPNAFGPGEGRLLTIAAAQVSVAIENARLLRSLRDRAMQLERALEELRELHRLKTEFVQNVSHELRTPLTFIKGYVQLILEEAMGEITPDLRSALSIVDQRTDAVIRLVNDVISLEQVEMGKFEFQPVSLAEIAAHSVEGAAMTARKSGVQIELEVVDDLPLVHADPGRLGQVFDNLLGNAIKFSPAGTSITVRVWRDGAFARADVKDQGIGIPADKLGRIFDRFYQVDGSTTRRYAGTGLGLAIVKTIVESHGGQVTAESEVGVGSTFSFILPIPTDSG